MIENQNIELKQIWKDDYLKSICAFANAQGGKLWVGLNDKSEISGISNYRKLLEDLPNKIRDIAKAFFRAGYIEVWGRGTINIVNYCKNAGLTVLFKKENKSFEELASLDSEKTSVKMPNDFGKSSEKNLHRTRKISNELVIKWSEKLVEKVGSKLVEKVGGKLVESQLKIILLMEENSRIKKAELSEILKISTTAIDKNITKLKKLNIIKRIGSDKGGHWEVINNG